MTNDAGEVGFSVLVGGGMGRTPVIGTKIREFLPWQQILVFIEAIVRVYNRYGRRDNMYKARIKILVKAEGESSSTPSKKSSAPSWSATSTAPRT